MDLALTTEGPGRVHADHIVQRARDGDVGAFELLLERRLTSLLRLAVAILGDEIDARDAVQQACVSAWRELPRLRDIDRFDAWLQRILTNQCRSALRSRRRRRLREIPVSQLERDALADFATESVAGPAEHTERLELVERAFERLRADDRTLLVRHYLAERSVPEMAADLDLPLSTVKWRLHRARGALDRALELERR